MKIYKEFKEMYANEHKRKETHSSKMSVMLTLFSICGIAITYLIQHLKNIENISPLFVLVIILLCTSVLVFVGAIIFLIKAFFWHKYYYLPKPKELDEYLNRCKKYYIENNALLEIDYKTFDEYFDVKFDELMFEFYRDATTKNLETNDKKIRHLNICTCLICISILISLVACGIFQLLPQKKQVTNIQIENSNNIKTHWKWR